MLWRVESLPRKRLRSSQDFDLTDNLCSQDFDLTDNLCILPNREAMTRRFSKGVFLDFLLFCSSVSIIIKQQSDFLSSACYCWLRSYIQISEPLTLCENLRSKDLGGPPPISVWSIGLYFNLPFALSGFFFVPNLHFFGYIWNHFFCSGNSFPHN